MTKSAAESLILKLSDTKRYLWITGYSVVTLTPIWAILAWMALDHALWTALLPLCVVYLVVPLLDALVGVDNTNPGERVLKAMAEDRFYMAAVHAVIPVGYLAFIAAMIFIVTQGLPFWAQLAFVLGTGTLNGSMITIGHELGHKTDRLNRFMAKLALGAVGYGHFSAEHNLGHHKNVSTPEDCASGRFGENIYAFAMRELPGALRGGWTIEKKRLEKRGHGVWSWRNEILQTDAITVVVALALILALGIAALPWIILHHFVAWFALTLVNYIEHYGLLRQRNENGRYEPCAPRHSWNANHIVSNIMQFHLQRHSDHHAHPARPYQVLRHFEGLPQLPTGYPGCMLMAMIPPLWFRVMDPKVMEWAGGELSKVNLHEPARARLEAKWAEGAA